MAANVPVGGGANPQQPQQPQPAAVPPAPPTDMEQALGWIGFTAPQVAALVIDFANFEDAAGTKSKEIDALASSYARRTAGDGRFHFGHSRTKHMKAFMHWIEDFSRVSEEPTIDGLDQATFREALQEAADRAEIRDQQSDQSSTLTREASPGKLVDGQKWVKWRAGLENMLSTMFGVTGIPLSYVIRENDDPEPDGHATFMQKCIACAPLEGPKFEADSQQVHQLILSFVQGEEAEQWIKKIRRHNDGRRDFQALAAHFEGEGNTSRRIAEAERIRDTVTYKNERALPFSKYLSKLQLMFNIFQEEGEEYTEAAKLRALLEKIQNPTLMSTVSAIKVRDSMTEGGTTFTQAANLLSADVSKMPEFINAQRNVAAAATSSGNIYNTDGTIRTGHIKDWKSLSKEDRDKVKEARAKTGVVHNKKAGKRRASAAKTKKRLSNLQKELESAKRSIAALQSTSQPQPTEDDAAPQDAGNSFGGRAEKKAKKHT